MEVLQNTVIAMQDKISNKDIKNSKKKKVYGQCFNEWENVL